MKPTTAGLNAVLALAEFDMADCYTFTLQNGFVVRYTTADYTITDPANGHVFASSATGPKLGRTSVKFHVGAQVDELDITLAASPTDKIDGTQWYVAMVEGLLDGATIMLQRAFMPTAGDASQGLITIFYGTVATCTIDRQKSVIKCTTFLDMLNQNMPFRIYGPNCKYALYGAGCNLVKASFAVSGTILASPASTITVANSNLSNATGYFNLGSMIFTSGAMNGESYPIKSHTKVGSVGSLNVMTPFSHVPATGDTFTAYPGCDKAMTTCDTKFSNLLNFGGYPFVPVPETAV